MRAENHARTHGYFLQLLHENGAGFAQLVHYVTVMDDLLADINRRAIEIQRDPDYVNRPDDACAKASRSEQNDFLTRDYGLSYE
jgi:hypothetical protein